MLRGISKRQLEHSYLLVAPARTHTDSVQAFKKRMKLGRFTDKDPAAEAEAAAQLEEERLLAEGIVVGSRCEVSVVGGMARRGTVMFTGEWDFRGCL